MDTRSKIVSQQTARERAAGAESTLLLSTFDVLTGPRIERVREVALTTSLLLVAISESEDSLLPAQARAELAASLSLVDVVFITDAPLTGFPAARIIDDTEADRGRTADLIEYIHQRNRA